MSEQPDLERQRSFWDRWNESHRTTGTDPFMQRQADEAQRVASSLAAAAGGRPLHILDVGCGTGWLAAELTGFGEVTATDLSQRSIEIGRELHPQVRFVAGDFATAELGGTFDLVVSADTIAHVADQPRFVDRVADLLVADGTFVLMTQNGFVWRRSSYLSPQGDGQLRSWPSLGAIRTMLRRQFELVRIGSIAPGGDRGVLWLTHLLRRGAGRIHIDRQMGSVQERARIGRELVVVARRRR